MSLEQPSLAAGYLHQILVNGATPFRYRSKVRSLLGMPDIDANPPAAASLPPIEFLYAIPRSISANLPDLIQQGNWESDTDAWAGWKDLPIAESTYQDDLALPLLNEPRTQTNLPTPPTLQVQQLAIQKSKPVQEQPISSAVERSSSSTMEEHAPLPTTDVLARETQSTIHLDNSPTAVNIPGVTKYHSPKVDRNQIILESSQQNELGKAVDSATQSDSKMNHQLMDVTAMPLPISERDPEAADALIPKPSSINSRSLKQSSSLQGLSNLGLTISTPQPQNIPSELEVDSPTVQPSTVSFRPKAKTDTSTILVEKLTAQSIPTPMLQGNSQDQLPIAAAPMPMTSTSNMPHNPALSVQPAAKVTEELTKLRHIVADLTTQVTAQKEFQRPAPPIVLPPSVQIVQRSVSPPKSPQAFWERSYVSRLYRWSRR